MFCEPKLGALGNPKVAYQLVIINDLKEIFSSIADAILMTCSQLWCEFQCWFRISHIQTILTLGDPIVICPSWEGTDPRCGKALCWPKEWFFIGTRCTVDSVDSVERGESTCNFGLYIKSYRYLYFLILFWHLFVKILSPEGHYKDLHVLRDVILFPPPEQMHFLLKSCQVDPSLHPGLFSYELVSQNCETWAVGTLDESWIDGSWSLETSEASGIPRLQCRGSWGALHVGRMVTMRLMDHGRCIM